MPTTPTPSNIPQASVPATGAKSTEVRNAIFASAKKQTKSEVITLFGHQIELRQPSLKDALNMGQNPDGSVVTQSLQVARSLVAYAYIPGTDNKVFSDSDIPKIESLNASQDMINAIQVMGNLTGVPVEEQAKK